MPSELSLLELIGSIYDAVLMPEGWHDALDRIRRQFDLHNAMMGLTRLGHEPTSIAVSVNIADEYLAMQGAEYTSAIVSLWGGPEQISRYPLEEPRSMLSVTDPALVATNKYYLDFGAPQGLDDMVAMVLTRDRRQVGNIGFGRHRDLGPVPDAVVAGLRVLGPHLRRAALITGILEENRQARRMLEMVLAALQTAVVLVDARSRLIYANPAAEEMLDAAAPLRLTQGSVEMSGELVPGQLQRTIAMAAEGDLQLGRRGIAIPGTRPDGEPYVVHLMPTAKRGAPAGLPGEAVAALFIADRADDPHLVVDAATLIYDLTPTEAKAFELVVAGLSSAEIARAMAISANTLKWHMRQLFEKTGQHRRADLVRLGAMLRPG